MSHPPSYRRVLERIDARPETDPREVIAQAHAVFGEHLALSSSLGPQSLALLAMAHEIGVPLRVFWLDTGLHFDETYALRREVEARYGCTVEVVAPALSLDAQRLRFGARLWRRDPDACCRERKVLPLQRHLRGLAAWMTGLRRDQASSRAGVEVVEWDARHGLVKLNPLAHWSRARVRAYLRLHDVPYNPLLDDGYASVGCAPCTARSAGDDERAGRWAGSAKTECGIHLSTSPQEGPQ